MIAGMRYLVSRLMPSRLKWWLVRKLPWAVTWVGKVFQGIDPIWDTDPDFEILFRHIASRVLMDRRRAYVLYNAARSVAGKDGDIAEMGVYRGGSAYLMLAATGDDKSFYGFDTFAGLPESDAARDPYWTAGDMSETSVADVAGFLGGGRAHLIEGLFPDSLAKAPEGLRFCLVHIDGDLYQTTLAALRHFYDRTVSGGIIMVNDYGFFSSLGVRAAVDEFFADCLEQPIYLPSGQCLVMKH